MQSAWRKWLQQHPYLHVQLRQAGQVGESGWQGCEQIGLQVEGAQLGGRGAQAGRQGRHAVAGQVQVRQAGQSGRAQPVGQG